MGHPILFAASLCSPLGSVSRLLSLICKLIFLSSQDTGCARCGAYSCMSYVTRPIEHTSAPPVICLRGLTLATVRLRGAGMGAALRALPAFTFSPARLAARRAAQACMVVRPAVSTSASVSSGFSGAAGCRARFTWRAIKISHPVHSSPDAVLQAAGAFSMSAQGPCKAITVSAPAEHSSLPELLQQDCAKRCFPGTAPWSTAHLHRPITCEHQLTVSCTDYPGETDACLGLWLAGFGARCSGFGLRELALCLGVLLQLHLIARLVLCACSPGIAGGPV